MREAPDGDDTTKSSKVPKEDTPAVERADLRTSTGGAEDKALSGAERRLEGCEVDKRVRLDIVGEVELSKLTCWRLAAGE